MRDPFLRCSITRTPFNLSLYLTHLYPNGEADILDLPSEPNYRKLSPGEEYQVPSPSGLNLSLEAGQQILDELWNLGYRPSKGLSSAGQDEAQKAHLADLRAIVFKVLDIKEG